MPEPAQLDPTFTQLPPGLDPSNLARLAQLAQERGLAARQAQAQEAPQGPTPQQPQPQPQQEAEADQSGGDPAAGATPAPPPEPEPPQSTFDPVTNREIVPQLQRRNEPYVPVGGREPHEWGTDWWPIQASAYNPDMQYGQFMPSPMEAYRVIQGAGGQLARWGSPTYGQYYGQSSQMAQMIGPWLDQVTGGRFTKGFNRARAGLLREQRDQMLLAHEQAIEQHQQFLMGANEIFGQYKFGGMTQKQAEDAMEDYLNQSQHQNLINMLHTRGLKGVQGFLQWEDEQWRNSLAAHTSLKRSTGDNGEAADRIFEGGGTPGSSSGERDLPGGPDDKTADNVPGAGQTPLGETPGLSVDEDLKKRINGLTDKETEAGRSLANGEKPIGFDQLTEGKQARINAAANLLRGSIDQIAREPGDSPEDRKRKLDAIGKVEPAQKSNLESILNYKSEAKDLGANPNERARLERLAKQIDKNYDAGNYHNVHKFWDTGSVENRTITRGTGLTQAWVKLNQALKQVPEDSKVLGNTMKAWLAGHAGDDDKWAAVYAALQQMSVETSAASTGGVPRQGLTMLLVKDLPPGATPAQVRTAMITHLTDVWAFIDGYQHQWEGITHRQDLVPGMDPDQWKLFSGILRSNPHTGEVPSDAPDVLKAQGKSFDQRSPRVKENNVFEAWRPLPLDKIPWARDYIQRNRDSTNPEERALAQKLEQSLGAVVHLPEELPADAR